jgi:hypothetical protein
MLGWPHLAPFQHEDNTILGNPKAAPWRSIGGFAPQHATF